MQVDGFSMDVVRPILSAGALIDAGFAVRLQEAPWIGKQGVHINLLRSGNLFYLPARLIGDAGNEPTQINNNCKVRRWKFFEYGYESDSLLGKYFALRGQQIQRCDLQKIEDVMNNPTDV